MNLTDEEIRINVHEALGWTKRMQGPTHYAWSRGDYWHHLHEVPNYPESLDAMYEAIMALPIDKRDQFDVELAVIVHGDFIRHQVRYQRFETTNATARQRCLAYLKTKNLIP